MEQENQHEEDQMAINDETIPSTDNNYFYSSLNNWICHMLIKLKLKYNCSNGLFTLIIAIINFIFSIIKHPLHLIFPKTLNGLFGVTALKIFNQFETKAVCPNPKCNYIYELGEIVKTARNGETVPATCKNKLFAKICESELSYCENLSFGRKKWVPYKKFPFLAPSKWINLFFKNKEFLDLIKQRPEPSSDGSLRDMWDGKIMRTFFKDPGDRNVGLLENKDNLALLLFLDFFNPFTRSVHSSGVLCMTVLNLPRSVRYQRKWSMLIGIIPGPEEAQCHINTFLKPVVDDLLSLYDGMKVRAGDGREFLTRAVLLPVLGDIPASRKVSQFLSFKANKPCDKCHMTAKREPGSVGASGRMSFVTKSMPQSRNDREVRNAMDKYKKCSSRHAADSVAKVSGVRYGELSRLPYFNTVDNFLIDPMHNLFLGLVEDLGNAIIEGDARFIDCNGQDVFQKRMNNMRLPYDVGRLPRAMLSKMSGRGITAQQWKNFIITFARVCLWKQVSEDAFKLVRCLAEACEVVLRDPMNENDVTFLERLLKDHHRLYARIFGQYSVSINYHMVLHLPEQIKNWGPATAWWCFPYERRIGELSDTQTSGKSVEEQIFNHFFLQLCASHSPDPLPPCSINEHLAPALRTLLEMTSSDCTTDSLQAARFGRVAEDFFTGRTKVIHGNEIVVNDPFCFVEKEEFSPTHWPVVLLPPKKINQRIQFSFLQDLKAYFKKLYNDEFILVEPRIDIFARCNVNGTLFSSKLNRTDRGSTVLSYCVDTDHRGGENAVPYFATVNFFFQTRVHVSCRGRVGRKMHSLAFVEWYRFANPKHTVDKLSGLHALQSAHYKGDNIINARRLIRRVVLAEVKKNYFLAANLSK